MFLLFFLYLKRAFETINIDLLLHKLQRIGFKGNVWKWLRDYLKERTQRVKFNETISDSLKITNGVPQGPFLGPLPFIIYINDIKYHIRHCNFKLFADD